MQHMGTIHVKSNLDKNPTIQRQRRCNGRTRGARGKRSAGTQAVRPLTVLPQTNATVTNLREQFGASTLKTVTRGGRWRPIAPPWPIGQLLDPHAMV
jgi:hypothetical protein